MDGPRLVIIGAGVAGLTAGCYAARSGYRTTILEMGQTPGGLCTSWRRNGCLFDGSVAGDKWVESWGGITTAARSARNAVRALCKQDGARFEA